jgi:hypothetical protein
MNERLYSDMRAIKALDACALAILDEIGVCKAVVHDACSCNAKIAFLKELDRLNHALYQRRRS